MSRRYVTVEDIRRLGAGELVVDDDTIVTPQALEVARAIGVTITSKSGDYREPAPDRGPDVALQAQHLPHLPEPAADGREGIGVVVTVVGRNRSGVLAEITSALSQLEVNVDDVSQKMVAEYFHLVLVVRVPEGGSFDTLKTNMECLGGEEDYVVRVMHEKVFRYMHRI